MDAAVSLHHHHHDALPAAASSSLPPPLHHPHRSLHLRHPPPTSVSTRLAVTAAPSRTPRRSSTSSSSAAAPAPVPSRSTSTAVSSARAATGYAAALADASLRAGTLPRAARHARALLRRLRAPPNGQRQEEADDRVSALVRMLVGKGKGGAVAEVLAEFAAIWDRLLVQRPTSASSKRAAHAHASY